MGLKFIKELEIKNVITKVSKKGEEYCLIVVEDDDYETMKLYSKTLVRFERGDVKEFTLSVDQVGFDTKLSIESIK